MFSYIYRSYVVMCRYMFICVYEQQKIDVVNSMLVG